MPKRLEMAHRANHFLLHAVIRELMNASCLAILCVLEWLYRLASTVFGAFLFIASMRGTETSDKALPKVSSRGESSTGAESHNRKNQNKKQHVFIINPQGDLIDKYVIP